MPATLLTIGLIVFFSHFLSFQFRRTRIPDVLVLMLVGILVGPVLGIVAPQDFGKVGSVIATIALVVILFEGGTSLKLSALGESLGTTSILSVACFILTAAIVAFVGFFVLKLELLPAIMLGVTLGGSTSAVVIPMVGALKLPEKPTTILVLESALTDVLCIVGVFALLQIYAHGSAEPGKLLGSVMASLVVAAVIGVLGGIGWLMVLGKIRDFPNTISSTLAYVFIVYGLTEMLDFSGAIAALALGISVTNYEKFGLQRIRSIDEGIEPLNQMDFTFYREAVFLLKTYFFIYLGISIYFGNLFLAIIALATILVVYLVRLGLVRFVFRQASYGLRDAAVISMMAPKGLAAAVLATIPLENGVAGGEVIRDITYMAVFISIVFTALLVMVFPLPGAQKFYSRALGKPGGQEVKDG